MRTALPCWYTVCVTQVPISVHHKQRSGKFGRQRDSCIDPSMRYGVKSAPQGRV